MMELKLGVLSVFYLYIIAVASLEDNDGEEFIVEMPGVHPYQDDAYLCTSVKVPAGDHYVVNFEPLANAYTAHHMLLYGCEQPARREKTWLCGSTCQGPSSILYAWAKNAPPTSMPKDVAFQIGDGSDVKYLVLQVHYKNGMTLNQLPDHTGTKLTMKKERQKYLAGMYLLVRNFLEIPAGATDFHGDVACQYEGDTVLHPFAFRVHAHSLANVITGYQNNGSFHLLGKGNPNWPQAFYPIDDPSVAIKPGDSVAARCTYNSDRDTPTHLGATHNDEMCNFYFMYYTDAELGKNMFVCSDNQSPAIASAIPADASVPLPSNPLLEDKAAGVSRGNHLGLTHQDYDITNNLRSGRQMGHATNQGRGSDYRGDSRNRGRGGSTGRRRQGQARGYNDKYYFPNNLNNFNDYYDYRDDNNDYGDDKQYFYQDTLNGRSRNRGQYQPQKNEYDRFNQGGRGRGGAREGGDGGGGGRRYQGGDGDNFGDDDLGMNDYDINAHNDETGDEEESEAVEKKHPTSETTTQKTTTTKIHTSTKDNAKTTETKAAKPVETKDNDENDGTMKEEPSWPNIVEADKLTLGQVAGVATDSKNNVHIFHRGKRVWDAESFDAYNKLKSDDPIQENTLITFSPEGKVLKQWGANLFYMPHGISIDKDDNIWLTDVGSHQVLKFKAGSSKPALTLGSKLEPGSDHNHFCKPTDVAILSNGQFFVSDGYCNNRILKFDKDGSFLLSWGEPTTDVVDTNGLPPPGAFDIPHSMTLLEDSKLLCVADRENGRIQCFDYKGKFVKQIHSDKFCGLVYGIAYNSINGQMYAVNGASAFDKHCIVQGFIIDPDTKNILSTWQPEKGFTMPHDMTTTLHGDAVYVTEIRPNKVWKFSVQNTGVHQSVKKAGAHFHGHPDTVDLGEYTDSDGEKKINSAAEATDLSASIVIGALLVIPVIVILIITIILRLRKRARAKGKYKMLHLLEEEDEGESEEIEP